MENIPDLRGAATPRLRPGPESRRPGPRTGRRAAIVVLDGALLDTREAQALSWLVSLHDAGHDVTIEVLRSLIGLPPGQLLRLATRIDADSADGRRIRTRRVEIFRTWYLRRVLPFSGARALLQRMRREGMRLIGLSSSTVPEAVDLVRAAGVGELLDDAVAQDDELGLVHLEDLVEAAVTQCACVRESVLLLADTPYHVEAGRREKVNVVALRCGGWRDAALDGALAIYDDPHQLLSQFDDSPFASGGTKRAPAAATMGDSAPGLSLMN
jgi:phosphoglycolate phosphatase-like HAD superfamily hydrolase